MEAGAILHEGAPLVGAQLQLGHRYSPRANHDSTWNGRFQEAIVGDPSLVGLVLPEVGAMIS